MIAYRPHNVLSTLRLLIMSVITSVMIMPSIVFATPTHALDFTFYQNKNTGSGPTLLVIGGIQGDEPGGFNAASILATKYRFSRGNVWVVPNLNFPSILKRSRGVHGDMNRKFSQLNSNDPEFDTVSKIKNIILQDEVDVVLNLHDGSGFYSPTYRDKLHNPKRWGQSIIIDQEKISHPRFANLADIAGHIIASTNNVIKNTRHRYHLKNTDTAKGDKEMEKTLTYFAIRHGKPAFGLEVSKEFGTVMRSYYHLLVMEKFMDHMGIEYQRNFPLSYQGVKWALYDNLQIALFENKVLLDVANARDRLRYVPLKKNTPLQVSVSNPLIAVLKNKHDFSVRYGNRSITSISPQFFEYDDSLKKITLLVDGEERTQKLGDVVHVREKFLVRPIANYRVNVIGYTRKGLKNESGQVVRRRNIISRYSIDNAARMFRVEFYQGKRYCGMILVNYKK